MVVAAVCEGGLNFGDALRSRCFLGGFAFGRVVILAGFLFLGGAVVAPEEVAGGAVAAPDCCGMFAERAGFAADAEHA